MSNMHFLGHQHPDSKVIITIIIIFSVRPQSYTLIPSGTRYGNCLSRVDIMNLPVRKIRLGVIKNVEMLPSSTGGRRSNSIMNCDMPHLWAVHFLLFNFLRDNTKYYKGFNILYFICTYMG